VGMMAETLVITSKGVPGFEGSRIPGDRSNNPV
jgi:hypothetical protein